MADSSQTATPTDGGNSDVVIEGASQAPENTAPETTNVDPESIVNEFLAEADKAAAAAAAGGKPPETQAPADPPPAGQKPAEVPAGQKPPEAGQPPAAAKPPEAAAKPGDKLGYDTEGKKLYPDYLYDQDGTVKSQDDMVKQLMDAQKYIAENRNPNKDLQTKIDTLEDTVKRQGDLNNRQGQQPAQGQAQQPVQDMTAQIKQHLGLPEDPTEWDTQQHSNFNNTLFRVSSQQAQAAAQTQMDKATEANKEVMANQQLAANQIIELQKFNPDVYGTKDSLNNIDNTGPTHPEYMKSVAINKVLEQWNKHPFSPADMANLMNMKSMVENLNTKIAAAQKGGQQAVIDKINGNGQLPAGSAAAQNQNRQAQSFNQAEDLFKNVPDDDPEAIIAAANAALKAGLAV